MPLERMGETLARKLVAQIEARKKIPLDLFLRALGIDELGKHVAKILATQFGNLEKLFGVTPEELAAIHTIGEKITASVVKGLKEKRSLIEKLLKVGATPAIPSAGVGPLEGGLLQGKSFLFTGGLASMSREEAQRLVEEKGGLAASGVSKNLDYLVVGGEGGAGSKLKKAEKLAKEGAKVKILSESAFKQLLGLT